MATVALPTRISWDDFLEELDWRQSEHVTLLGHNGSGKTTLARHLLPERKYRLVIATKLRDDSIDAFKKRGYFVTRTWPVDHRVYSRIVYWPQVKNIDDTDKQSADIFRCLNHVYKMGYWCIYFDEVRYITEVLGLSHAVSQLWREGRSSGISVVAGTQRPAWIPREAYSEATHLFIWRSTNRYDLKRLEEASNIDPRELSPIIANLPKHDVLYVNTRSGEYIRTRVSV